MVSIIIIEYHSLEEIERVHDSIKENMNEDYELVISSNSLYDSEKQNSRRQ